MTKNIQRTKFHTSLWNLTYAEYWGGVTCSMRTQSTVRSIRRCLLGQWLHPRMRLHTGRPQYTVDPQWSRSPWCFSCGCARWRSMIFALKCDVINLNSPKSCKTLRNWFQHVNLFHIIHTHIAVDRERFQWSAQIWIYSVVAWPILPIQSVGLAWLPVDGWDWGRERQRERLKIEWFSYFTNKKSI